MKSLSFIISNLVILTLQSAVYAENVISFEDLLDTALNKSPLIAEIEATNAYASAESVEVALIKNPEIRAEVKPYADSITNGELEYEVSIALPLKGSDFGLRNKISELMSHTASIDKKISLISFIEDLKLTYGIVWLLQERDNFSKEIGKRIKDLQGRINTMNSSGLLSASSSKLVLAQSSKIKADTIGIQSKLYHYRAELIRKSGVDTRGVKMAPIFMEAVKEEFYNESSNSIPILERVKLKTILSEKQKELVKLDTYTHFAPNIGFEHTDTGDNRILAGFTLELPIFNQSQSQKIKAESDIKLNDDLLKFFNGDGFKGEVKDLTSSFNSSLEQIRIYENEVIPFLLQALTQAYKELSSGQANVSQVIQTLTSLLEAKDRHLDLWIQAISNRVELSILLGKSV